MPAGTKRLDSLTSLRYFAALAVVLCHVNPYFLSNLWQRDTISYGYVGVSFFYLLSGFVLTWSCAEQPATRFWWRRFARIWPLMAVMMTVAYTALWNRELHPGSAGGWLAQVFLLQAWDPNTSVRTGGDGPAWSLSCEMFFYAAFPLLIRWVGRLRARGVALAAAATVAAMIIAPLVTHVNAAEYYWLFYYLPGYRICEFIIGMLLARAVRLGLRIRYPSLGYLVALAGLALWAWGIADATVRDHGTNVGRPWVALLALPSLALLVLARASADLDGRARLLGRRLPVLLGTWSFALYLVHDVLSFLVSEHGWLSAHGKPGGVGDLVAFIACATALAALAHYAIERPAERWLRAHRPGRDGLLARLARLARRWRVPAAPGVPAPRGVSVAGSTAKRSP